LALLAVFVALLGAFIFIRPLVVIAQYGSGLDPRIPPELRVAPSIHPELAEHSQIFEKKVYSVGDRVKCAVGWGIANIILVEGTDGVIIVDTGENLDQARAVLAEFRKTTAKPVAAVVLTHHHADHVLGTAAFIDPADAATGKVPVIGHDSLVKQYVDETGILAELQTARSAHMYGAALGPADREHSNAGIGPFSRRAQPALCRPIAPSRTGWT
jgi:alkyl sulfatase BDS1-like metallo-beta-lactamase superfamily hydrolase